MRLFSKSISLWLKCKDWAEKLASIHLAEKQKTTGVNWHSTPTLIFKYILQANDLPAARTIPDLLYPIDNARYVNDFMARIFTHRLVITHENMNKVFLSKVFRLRQHIESPIANFRATASLEIPSRRTTNRFDITSLSIWNLVTIENPISSLCPSTSAPNLR
jgi:hypothetical protein